MINPKKLIEITRRWHRIAAIRRKRISFTRISSNRSASSYKTASSASTGNFVIYTNDHKRFAIPVAYLSNNIIKELFKMSEEVFELPSQGPIKLPCDAVFMEYVVSLIKRGLAKDIEDALLMSMEATCFSFSANFHRGHSGHQLLICGY